MKPEDKDYIVKNIGKKSIREIAANLNLKERKIKKFLEKREHKEKAGGLLPEKQTTASRKIVLISIFLIAVSGFLIYTNSLNGDFIWDDYYLIKDNTFIKSLSYITNIFKTDIAAGSGKEANAYRPFQTLSYMLDYSIWGLNKRGYHITNVLLHILAAISIYWFVNSLLGSKPISFLTSAFFITHPVHTEAVSYISGRADPLSLIFIMLSFVFYIKYIDNGKRYIFILMLISYISALFSRETSLIFPVLLLIYHYSFDKKVKKIGILSIFAATFIYLLMRAAILKVSMPHTSSETTLLQRLPGSFVAITNYLKLMILPLGLHMEYGFRPFSMADPKALLGIVLSVFLLLYTFKSRSKNSILFFSTFWFFLSLLPSLNLYPLNAYMAEHWLYLPSVGFFLMLAWISDCATRSKALKKPVTGFCAALIAVYSLMTISQNRYWQDDIRFYERTLKYAPDNIRVLNSLGLLYHEQKKYDEAIKMYKRAIEISPGYIDAYNNLGIVYRNLKKPKEAIEIYKKAIEMNPNFVYTYCNLANAYKDIGNPQEAIGLYKKAIDIYPNFSYAYNNLGLTYKDFGMNGEAEAAYKKAIELKPDYMEAYSNLGALYFNNGRKEEALAMFSKAVELNPFNAMAYTNLAASYTDAGRYREAIEAFKKALAIKPDYALAHYNLAVTYLQVKEYGLAVKHYDKAIALGYKDDSNLGQVLAPYRI